MKTTKERKDEGTANNNNNNTTPNSESKLKLELTDSLITLVISFLMMNQYVFLQYYI